MNERIKNLITWGIICIVLFIIISGAYNPERTPPERVSYSDFVKSAHNGDIVKVVVSGDQTIGGQLKSGQNFITQIPQIDAKILDNLLSSNIDITARMPEQQSLLLPILINWVPTFIICGLLFWMLRQSQSGGGRNPLSFGRSRARVTNPNAQKCTFADVAGMDEAKNEVEELVQFLKDPQKFQKLGGKVPCGALLIGPPGTGKTMLARAVAGEANVPFFSISGSDFVEMFVGVGASRVRDMFDQAKKQAPSIIFIDEIDAVARARGVGWGGGNDEREQTLNQLLVEMDGFEGKEGVIVMAATNRVDVLDPALLRPGRFDRQVFVSLPDIRGREQILNVHIKKIVVDKSVDASVIARGTPGLSGASLANLVNEAALIAARKNKRKVSMQELESAKDKILLGAERNSMVMTEKEKLLTAYHESGHAIVGLLIEGNDPVYKVTIMPRGHALGVTMFLPDQDRYSLSLQQIEGRLASLFGGRVAEELIFGLDQVTTGASNDIEKASEMARSVVTRWGLDKGLGPIHYSAGDDDSFGGRMHGKSREFSEKTAERIDAAVSAIIDRNYARCKAILTEHIDKLHTMANALMLYETIDEKQLSAIMEGRTIPAPKGWKVAQAPHESSNDDK